MIPLVQTTMPRLYLPLILIFLSVLDLRADGALNNGAIYTDSISPAGDLDEWIITVSSGDYIVASVTATDPKIGGVFEPNVRLIDPGGGELARDKNAVSVRLMTYAQSSGVARIQISDLYDQIWTLQN